MEDAPEREKYSAQSTSSDLCLLNLFTLSTRWSSFRLINQFTSNWSVARLSAVFNRREFNLFFHVFPTYALFITRWRTFLQYLTYFNRARMPCSIARMTGRCNEKNCNTIVQLDSHGWILTIDVNRTSPLTGLYDKNQLKVRRDIFVVDPRLISRMYRVICRTIILPFVTQFSV